MPTDSPTEAVATVSDLRRRFAQILVGATPAGSSLLDLGAGVGDLVAVLRRSGFEATGIEPDRRQSATARAAGIPVQTGFAESLPLGTLGVDVVVMRHSLHHCFDPGRALGEACRVARVAILTAEPWHPVDESGGGISLEFDLLLKSWHRRTGRVHAPNLRRASILDRVASDWVPVPESAAIPRFVRCTESWTEAAMRSEAAGYSETVATTAERHSFDRLCRSAAAGEIPRPGSELTFLTRGAAPSGLQG